MCGVLDSRLLKPTMLKFRFIFIKFRYNMSILVWQTIVHTGTCISTRLQERYWFYVHILYYIFLTQLPRSDLWMVFKYTSPHSLQYFWSSNVSLDSHPTNEILRWIHFTFDRVIEKDSDFGLSTPQPFCTFFLDYVLKNYRVQGVYLWVFIEKKIHIFVYGDMANIVKNIQKTWRYEKIKMLRIYLLKNTYILSQKWDSVRILYTS